MIIDLTYDRKKSFRTVKREANHILGIKNKRCNIFEYNGMLISYNKRSIQINTLLADVGDFKFLVQILTSVFKDSTVGISGIPSNKCFLEIDGVTIFWI